jgi:uncharacterized protein
MERIETAFASNPHPDQVEITQALWSASAGGQLEAAIYLVDRGADINWVGWDDLTALDVAEHAGSTELPEWLLARGAKHAIEMT